MVSLVKNPYLVLVVVLLLMATSSSHPTSNGGYTGAPGDGVCAQCHSGTNPALDGEITIDGVPASITAGQLYNVTVTVSNPNLAANRAGFQIVALNQSNSNAGNFTNPSVASSIKTSAGKKYFGHAPAVPFSGNIMLTWTVDWTAPVSGTGIITFYGGSVIANGNSSNSGDRFVVTQSSGSLSGSSTPLSVSLSNVTHVSCNGGFDGSATAEPSGGSPNYSYAWNNGESTATAFNLPAGLAWVTVTDNVGATSTASVNITQPSLIVVNVINTQSPTCFNSDDGSIIVNATGGVGGFFYDWSNGFSGASIGGLSGGTYEVTVTDNNNCTSVKQVSLSSPPAIEISSAFIQNVNCFGQSTGSIGLFTAGGTGTLQTTWSNGQMGEDILNLAAGFYTASVTDDDGCFITETYQITQPALLNPTINITTQISCTGGNNGVLVVTVAGGTSPYNYLWSNGSIANSASGLAAGTHAVTVTDNKGCISIKQSMLSNPTPIAISTATTTNASCPGVANGSASITITGGKSPYIVNWTTGATGTTLSNVTSGTYPLTVTDNAGCIVTSQVVIGSNQSAVLSADSIVNPNCFGASNGSIDISATNAIEYTINWSNGDTGKVLTNLTVGTYTAQASNSQGCLSNALLVTLSQPQPIQAVIETLQQITCFGLTNGTIQTEFNGGTGVLQYAWSNGINAAALENLGAGSYTLTVSDTNGCSTLKSYLILEPSDITIDSFDIVNPVCFGLATGIISIYPSGGTGSLTTNWTGGYTGNTLNNIQAGTFATSISDANSCLESDTFSVTAPTEIIVNDSLNNETSPGLANGSIYCETTGGISPYGYIWSTGDTTSFIDSLSPGLYLLTITDEIGCTRSFQFNVQTGDCALAANYAIMPVSCFGGNDGAVTLDITNGFSPYTVNNPTSQLEAGTYNYVITDAAGCTFTIDDVAVTQPALIVVVIDSVVNTSGPNVPDGGIDVSVTGGTPSYVYEWRDAADSLVSNLQDARTLFPGLYFFQVIDANGCIAVRDSIVVSFASNAKSADNLMVFFTPNPFGAYLKVESNLLPVKVVFYDLRGRILSSTLLDEHNDNTLNSENWPSGMYIGRLSLSTGESKTVKVVKY